MEREAGLSRGGCQDSFDSIRISGLGNCVSRQMRDNRRTSAETSTRTCKFLRVPKFDPRDEVRKRLAELSMQAHELARTPAGSEPQAVSRELEAVEALEMVRQ